MSQYDVVLVLISVFGFVTSVATVGIRFTKAVSEVKAATEALRDAVSELRRITSEIKKENRQDHGEFNRRLNEGELRLTKMETEISYIALQTHSVRLAADSSLHAALSKRVGGRKLLKKGSGVTPAAPPP